MRQKMQQEKYYAVLSDNSFLIIEVINQIATTANIT